MVAIATPKTLLLRAQQLDDLDVIGRATNQAWYANVTPPQGAKLFDAWRQDIVVEYMMQHGRPPLPGFTPTMTAEGLIVGPGAFKWYYDPARRVAEFKTTGCVLTLNLSAVPRHLALTLIANHFDALI